MKTLMIAIMGCLKNDFVGNHINVYMIECPKN